MTRKRDRAFALTLAIVFFITAFGFSFLVIWQLYSQRNQSNNTPQTATCIGTPIEPQLALPTVYKPTAPVTSLQVTDLQPGSGTAAKSGNCLTVQYYGTLASDGTVFDQNFTKGTGFEFHLGQGQVIPGWDQGLVGMKVGGQRRLVIPAALAYGSTGSGPIPANATLVFVVKLLGVSN